MRVAFVLCLFGQRFAFESEPEEQPGEQPAMSAVAETERDPIGFSATPSYYEEEEERRR